MAKTKRKRELKRPWGGVAALLGAGAVTILGVGCGLEPATILFRAFTVGMILGVLAAVAGSLFSPVPRTS